MCGDSSGCLILWYGLISANFSFPPLIFVLITMPSGPTQFMNRLLANVSLKLDRIESVDLLCIYVIIYLTPAPNTT